MPETNCSAVGVFLARTDADEAIKELHGSGCDMRKLWFVAKDCETRQDAVGCCDAREPPATWSIGIPKDSVLRYETAFLADKFLVVIHGTAQEVEHARSILAQRKAEEAKVHGVAANEPVTA